MLLDEISEDMLPTRQIRKGADFYMKRSMGYQEIFDLTNKPGAYIEMKTKQEACRCWG